MAEDAVAAGAVAPPFCHALSLGPPEAGVRCDAGPPRLPAARGVFGSAPLPAPFAGVYSVFPLNDLILDEEGDEDSDGVFALATPRQLSVAASTSPDPLSRSFDSMSVLSERGSFGRLSSAGLLSVGGEGGGGAEEDYILERDTFRFGDRQKSRVPIFLPEDASMIPLVNFDSGSPLPPRALSPPFTSGMCEGKRGREPSFHDEDGLPRSKSASVDCLGEVYSPEREGTPVCSSPEDGPMSPLPPDTETSLLLPNCGFYKAFKCITPETVRRRRGGMSPRPFPPSSPFCACVCPPPLPTSWSS